MSLKSVLKVSQIKERLELLQNYLITKPDGELPSNEKEHFKLIFEKFYTPDEIQNKFNKNDISNVKITYHAIYNTKCFEICINNKYHQNELFYTTVKRLAGSNRTSNANLQRALRSAIEPQIKNFRTCNPLNTEKMCPVITTVTLGNDAEVDHIKPFNKLVNEWKLTNNIKKTNVYNIIYPTKDNYVLKEPYFTSWYDYHLKNAELRYLSKAGNKIAHNQT